MMEKLALSVSVGLLATALSVGVTYAAVDDTASGVYTGPFTQEYYGGDYNGEDYYYIAGSQNHFSWPVATSVGVGISSMYVYSGNPTATCTNAVYYASSYQMGSLNQYYNDAGWYQMPNMGGSVASNSTIYAAGYATANSGKMIADAVEVYFDTVV